MTTKISYNVNRYLADTSAVFNLLRIDRNYKISICQTEIESNHKIEGG